MMLLVDVGNTRIKWALVKDGRWLQQDYALTQDMAILVSQWQEIDMPDHIVGSNVAGEEIVGQLEILVKSCFFKSIVWLRVTENCCGVINHYKNSGKLGHYSSTLGPDRWAALVAVHHHYRGDRIVVNVGTAVTVDALTAQGEFLGGLILPGVNLMQKALNIHTARLPHVEGQYIPFPTTTSDAIYTGILTALASSIEAMVQRLREYCRSTDIQCLVSGGDAKLVLPYLYSPSQAIEMLVLQGLAIIAQSDVAV